MRVSIIGTGYVGLVSGACLAARGHEVICVDHDPERVALINAGRPPIHEAGLAQLLRETVGTTLVATTDLATAVRQTEMSLIAVGTPFDGDRIDLTQVRDAVAALGEVLATKDDYHAVIVKSTVVPGTTEDVVGPLLERTSGKRAGADFGVGMNPEFLREGAAVADFMHPDRIVLGGIDDRTIAVLRALYAPFEAETVATTPRTAEMIKYTANSLLATLISFTNEIANVCSAVGSLDVTEVMRGVHLDHRLNPILADGTRANPAALTYLAAGCGFGGSCFPKDVKALTAHARQHGYRSAILEAVMAVNEAQPGQVLELLARRLPDLAGRRIAVLGVAFKPHTDDIRESPALHVVADLLAAGAAVTAHDPVALPAFQRVFGDRVTAELDLAAAVADADAVVLVTGWPDYQDLPTLLDGNNPDAIVIDGRRMFAPDDVAHYEGIGR